MKPDHDPSRLDATNLDAATLDRLADGELSGDAYRQALASVAAAPDGWRRLALAFLEAQAWRQEFGAAEPATLVAPAPTARAPRRTVGAWSATWLALAASLCGVALGLVLRGGEGPVPGPPDAVAEAAPAPGPSMAEPRHAPRLLPAGDVPRGMVRLVVAGQRETIDLPVYAFDDASPETLARLAHPDAARMARELEAEGYDVERRQRIEWIDLDDGRRLAAPVEELELRPASWAGLQ